MSEARAYQSVAVQAVREHWAQGRRSVCLVAPTGAGKTEMGRMLVGGGRVLWTAHRRDLVLQTAERLGAVFGRREVGVIVSGEHVTSLARVQVATVQSYLARDWSGALDPFEYLVLDEAHHYMADEWRGVLGLHPNILTLGLTATPERQDGRGLEDNHDAMVVAANYSELIASGFLVPAKVWRPSRRLGSDLAQDPVAAYRRYGEGGQAFCFCARVPLARDAERRFREVGLTAETITADTPSGQRDAAIDAFRRGALRVLVNCNVLTEGIDVPEASVAILAKNYVHVGGLLQASGRVLRPSLRKRYAVVIDLSGSTLRHGSPTEDRVYSLDGRPISTGELTEREPSEGERPEFEQEVLGLDLEMVSDGVDIQAEADTPAPKLRRKRTALPSPQSIAGTSVPRILA